MDKFLRLKIKTKLTFGIGLLFTMIVLLGGLAVQNITDMSSDTQNILADNYNSLLYSRRMLDALERIKNDPQARAEFEKNLDLQQKNITEIDENVATAHLVAQYEAMHRDLNDTTIQRVRMALNDIMSLNMATIYRKSKVAERTADQALLWICIIAVACVLIAFAFLIRLPRSITSPIRKLTDGILEIANHNYEKRLDLGDNQEFAEVASSFNRMAERLTEYRKSTLADIIQAKKYIEAIVNSITEPIIGLDRDRSILFANDEALTILNLKRENVMGKSATELALKNDLLRRLVRELIQHDKKKEPLKIYADDKEINLYLNRYNEANVGQEITEDQFEPYKHHGSVHKNQIKLKTEGTTISATGTKVTVYLEYKDLEQYKEAFLRFVKPFSDTDIEKCWEQVLEDDTRVIEFDGFSTETSKFNGNIEYMSIYGSIE